VAEIEKSVIRPTLEEWKTIFEQSDNKRIEIHVMGQGQSSYDKFTSDRWAELYAAFIRQETGTNVDETILNILGGLDDGHMFYKLGFNSNKEAKWVIDAIKQPEIKTLRIYIDGNAEITKIDYELKGQFNTAQYPVIYNQIKSNISFDSRRNYRVNNSKDVIVEDLQDEDINIFNFDNTERVRVSFIKTDSYSIDPSNMETLNFKTNFLPTKMAITNDITDINDLHEYNNVYIIKPKALNKLLSGKKIQPRIIDDLRRLEEDKYHFENDPTHPDINLINQPLEPIPNYFKENTYQDKLNEVLTPKSVKKITSRLQYEVRLQGRQSREGRGEGKYTGDRGVRRNKPQLGFVLYHIKGHDIYFPKMKETLPLYIVAFYIKKYPYGDERWFPADEQQGWLYSESEVNRYVSPKQMSNKDWIKVSKNLIRDTVVSIVSYLKSLKVSYRVKGKLDLDKFTDKVQDIINNNIKDIVENSMFGFLSQTARRGRRMQVKKNLLKSASEIKNTGNTVMRNEFGPLKEFKDLSKDEIEKFVGLFKDNNFGKEYDFENTQYNLKYKFEPLNLDSISVNLRNVGNATKENLINKVRNLDGDVFQYFSISSEVSNQQETGMGILVFCYFFKDDKLDKIEGVVVSFARHKSKPVINVAKKEISTVYPFDDMGVFMYEIITGPKFDLLFRTDFSGIKYKDYPNTPVRRAQGFLSIGIKQAEAKGQVLFNNLKFNTLRNEVIGSLVGRNESNAMYYYLYPDSDYYGGTEQGQICIGKIDLVYKSIKNESWMNFSTKRDLEDYPTLQSFKENFSVGVTATTTGTCVHGHSYPKGDITWSFAGLFLLGTDTDYDKESTPFNPSVPGSGPKYQNIKDNTNQLGLSEGVPYDMMARRGPEGGVAGIDTQREGYRLTTHLTLVRKYGQEFLNWTDSLVKKVLESGEVKIGGKELDMGTSTSSGQSFNEHRGHSAFAHIPEEIPTAALLEELKEKSEEARIFYQRYGRLPHGGDIFEMIDIEDELNNRDEGE